MALTLGDLNNRLAFVGGAVSSLYADDPGAADVRPTKDIDVVVEVSSYLELTRFQHELLKKGFSPTPHEKVICRFQYDEILVDVMATEEVGWAPANPWFKPGFSQLEAVRLNTVEIKILPLAYFLASKFCAFNDRGIDPRTSSDFEDIVYILDNRTTLVYDILTSENDVKEYLISELKEIKNDASLQEAALACLEPSTQIKRFEMLEQKLKEIID